MNAFSTPASEASAELARSCGLAERFRKPLISVNTCLSLYSGIQRSRHALDSPERQTWDRIEKVLFENLDDLMDRTPVGERLVSHAAILSLVADGRELLARDREFHFLLSLYMQSCILINLIEADPSCADGGPVQSEAYRKRIQNALDFVTIELAELGRRRSQSAA